MMDLKICGIGVTNGINNNDDYKMSNMVYLNNLTNNNENITKNYHSDLNKCTNQLACYHEIKFLVENTLLDKVFLQNYNNNEIYLYVDEKFENTTSFPKETEKFAENVDNTLNLLNDDCTSFVIEDNEETSMEGVQAKSVKNINGKFDFRNSLKFDLNPKTNISPEGNFLPKTNLNVDENKTSYINEMCLKQGKTCKQVYEEKNNRKFEEITLLQNNDLINLCTNENETYTDKKFGNTTLFLKDTEKLDNSFNLLYNDRKFVVVKDNGEISMEGVQTKSVESVNFQSDLQFHFNPKTSTFEESNYIPEINLNIDENKNSYVNKISLNEEKSNPQVYEKTNEKIKDILLLQNNDILNLCNNENETFIDKNFENTTTVLKNENESFIDKTFGSTTSFLKDTKKLVNIDNSFNLLNDNCKFSVMQENDKIGMKGVHAKSVENINWKFNFQSDLQFNFNPITCTFEENNYIPEINLNLDENKTSYINKMCSNKEKPCTQVSDKNSCGKFEKITPLEVSAENCKFSFDKEKSAEIVLENNLNTTQALNWTDFPPVQLTRVVNNLDNGILLNKTEFNINSGKSFIEKSNDVPKVDMNTDYSKNNNNTNTENFKNKRTYVNLYENAKSKENIETEKYSKIETTEMKKHKPISFLKSFKDVNRLMNVAEKKVKEVLENNKGLKRNLDNQTVIPAKKVKGDSEAFDLVKSQWSSAVPVDPHVNLHCRFTQNDYKNITTFKLRGSKNVKYKVEHIYKDHLKYLRKTLSTISKKCNNLKDVQFRSRYIITDKRFHFLNNEIRYLEDQKVAFQMNISKMQSLIEEVQMFYKFYENKCITEYEKEESDIHVNYIKNFDIFYGHFESDM